MTLSHICTKMCMRFRYLSHIACANAPFKRLSPTLTYPSGLEDYFLGLAFPLFVYASSDDSGECVYPVIFLPAHPASFAQNFVSGLQSFHFSESQDAMVLQTCLEK